jgi:hypothetical protein
MPDWAPESRLPSWVTRWVGPAFLGMSVVLLPWIVYLRLSLPQQQMAAHYRTAWVGFDVILFGQLARTGIYAASARFRTRVRPHAAACAALLVADAWFDMTTSTRDQLPVSIAMAVLVELPLAAACWLLATRELVLSAS